MKHHLGQHAIGDVPHVRSLLMQVYLGLKDETRDVAIKCLNREITANAEQLNDFQQEVRLMANCYDNNIVQLYGCVIQQVGQIICPGELLCQNAVIHSGHNTRMLGTIENACAHAYMLTQVCKRYTCPLIP